MNPLILGKKYDKIARIWHNQLVDSDYGLRQIERALQFCSSKNTSLDVGCGSGGRIIKRLQKEGFKITGVDVSEQMLRIAKENHPEGEFYHADICEWSSDKTFDLIVAWDSIFHLPFDMQPMVLNKLCNMLNREGIFIYTCGNDYGYHESTWHDDQFYYSSIGINNNLKLLMNEGCKCLHLELDDYPERHVTIIVVKTASEV